jgi:signal transduction histidine kinase
MSSRAAEWSHVGAEDRFGEAPRARELSLLARNLDGVLDRVTALLRHEQQVTEELSHELRTPLSVVTAELDLLQARHRDDAEVGAAVTRLAAAAGQMNEIIETLLTTARSRSSMTAGRCRIAEPVAAAVARAPSRVAIHVQQADPQIWVGVDAQVVERILAPVLDNAVRFASSRVDVAVIAASPHVVIRIHDDGPGVDAALGDAAFDPGRRGIDEHGGAGLGLALARRLARATGGDVVLTAEGFELVLPLDPRDPGYPVDRQRAP